MRKRKSDLRKSFNSIRLQKALVWRGGGGGRNFPSLTYIKVSLIGLLDQRYIYGALDP